MDEKDNSIRMPGFNSRWLPPKDYLWPDMKRIMTYPAAVYAINNSLSYENQLSQSELFLLVILLSLRNPENNQTIVAYKTLVKMLRGGGRGQQITLRPIVLAKRNLLNIISPDPKNGRRYNIYDMTPAVEILKKIQKEENIEAMLKENNDEYVVISLQEYENITNKTPSSKPVESAGLQKKEEIRKYASMELFKAVEDVLYEEPKDDYTICDSAQGIVAITKKYSVDNHNIANLIIYYEDPKQFAPKNSFKNENGWVEIEGKNKFGRNAIPSDSLAEIILGIIEESPILSIKDSARKSSSRTRAIITATVPQKNLELKIQSARVNSGSPLKSRGNSLRLKIYIPRNLIEEACESRTVTAGPDRQPDPQVTPATAQPDNQESQEPAMTSLCIYTDGACPNNQSESPFGGWAWAQWSSREAPSESPDAKGSGGANDTTNNLMEITAIVSALNAFPRQNLDIHTDSQLCIGWFSQNWKTKRGNDEPQSRFEMRKLLILQGRAIIENRERNGITTTFVKVKGHSTDKKNHYVDRLAVTAAEKQKSQTR